MRSTSSANCSTCPRSNAIGYCVAGTTLATTLAYLTARGEEAKVASATFFTAQVDFSQSGELNLFIDDSQLAMVDAISKESGYLDGRFLAVAFNMLRSRDLIWSYVVDNYLLGKRLSGLRSAALERRHDEPAGQVAPELSARLVP